MIGVDTHTHTLPAEIPDWESQFGYPGFIGTKAISDEKTSDKFMTKNGNFFRRIQCNCFDHDERIIECDRDNIGIQVLSTVPVMFNYWAKPSDCMVTSQYLNDHIATVCKNNPSRFIGLGTVPLQDTGLACQELERCMDIGLKGVEIGTHVMINSFNDPETKEEEDCNLDHERFRPFWKKVEELGAVVFVHPWDMMGFKRLEKYWLPWLVSMPAETSAAICCMIMGGVYKEFPGIKVYYAHGGGSFFGTFERIQQGYNVRPDLQPFKCSPRDYLKYIRVDSLTHDPDMTQKIIKYIGVHSIMLGTDYPFPLGEVDSGGKTPGDVVNGLYKDGKLSKHETEQIMYLNAINFFSIKDTSALIGQDNRLKVKKAIIGLLQDPRFMEDPGKFCETLSYDGLESILTEVCRVYYTWNHVYFDNDTYDSMRDILKKKGLVS